MSEQDKETISNKLGLIIILIFALGLFILISVFLLGEKTQNIDSSSCRANPDQQYCPQPDNRSDNLSEPYEDLQWGL